MLLAARWLLLALWLLASTFQAPWRGTALAGPNSGSLDDDTKPSTMASMMLGTHNRTFQRRGEGSRCSITPRRGADTHCNLQYPRKNYGSGLVGPPGATLPPRAVKRSYKRAFARARHAGWTFYKGQLLTLPKLGVPEPHRQPPCPHPHPAHLAPKASSRRAAVLTWNAGGLASEIYHDLLAWLCTQKVDIALIQGTRWRDERTWKTHEYSVIQSGEDSGQSPSHGGLLVFISDRICQFDAISYAVIVPGRLMHVKCHLDNKQSVDIVNLYQYPDAQTQSRHRPLAARGEIWTQLDQLLHRLARRNITIVAGDFNCPLAPGHNMKHVPADIHDLAELTKKYYLQSVRTYDKGPTYIGPQGSSCIDHILIPQAKLDAHGRLGRALPDFPVASWRTCRDHIPVICSISLGWKCWFHKPPHKHVLTKHTKQALFEAWQHRTFEWTRLQDTLSQDLQTIPTQLTQLATLKHKLLSKCHHALRTPSTSTAKPAPKHRSIIAQLWHSYGIVRRTNVTTTMALFEAWKHASRLQALKKRLSASCRHAKAQRLHQAVADAHHAALRHDTRTVFAIIRKITPRQPYRTIRLRGPKGEAIPAFEEGRQLVEHFQTVFQSTTYSPPLNMGQLSHLPFTFDALVNGFHKAPITKAVGPCSLPNLMLRLLAEPLAEWLWPALTDAWCNHENPPIPQDWKDAWLVLLAKRLVKQPKDIRPIALTDSIGNTVLGLLTQELKPQILPAILRQPIFAFVPARGTLEALMFACDHCRQVRPACESVSPSYWRRAHHTAIPMICGGMILSLDMSQAFDRLPRTILAKGFAMLEVDPQLSQFFLKWLDQASYHFDHRKITNTVLTSQGVRQGCKASPIEWTIFLYTLLARLDDALQTSHATSWVAKHLLTYADDLLAKWSFFNKEEIHEAVRQIGVILDVLETIGMHINTTKSVILIRLSGKHSRAIKKKLFTKQQGQTGLLIPRAHGPATFLPIVHQHSYLGIKISFHQFEDYTLQYRLHIGRIAFLRLRPWLLKRHSYPLDLRLQLWQACIRSSCLHGLQATGLTPGGLQKLHRHLVADLRRIARSPSHITHETTADLLQRLNVPMPLVHLQEHWHQQYERFQIRWQGLPTGDFLLNFDMQAHHCHIMQV